LTGETTFTDEVKRNVEDIIRDGIWSAVETYNRVIMFG
jgi:hypothetical protein